MRTSIRRNIAGLGVVFLGVILSGSASLASTGRIFGDVSGGYSWGTYSSPGQPDNAHAGMAILGRVGYRLPIGVGMGLGAAMSFPQITIPGTPEEAAYRSVAMGLHASYQWRSRLEAMIHYSPVARLSHVDETSANPAVGPATEVRREIAYSGYSFGTGLRLQLTPPAERAQVGLTFLYAREAYNRALIQTTVESAPAGSAYSPHSATSESKSEIVRGNTYQMGISIGL